jgi:hypothetical protein
MEFPYGKYFYGKYFFKLQCQYGGGFGCRFQLFPDTVVETAPTWGD